MNRLKVTLVVVFLTIFVLGISIAKNEKQFTRISSFRMTSGMDIFELKGVMLSGTAQSFARQILTSNSKRVYVYIDSPGGSVMALDAMLDTMKSSGKMFTCVAKSAYSAAFMFFQMCDERYILTTGTLMSHEASMRAGGTIKQIRRVVTLLEKILLRLELAVAKRMDIEHATYRRMIAYDLWMDVEDARKLNAADGSIDKISCSRDLIEDIVETTVNTPTIFGPREEVSLKSRCPLID